MTPPVFSSDRCLMCGGHGNGNESLLCNMCEDRLREDEMHGKV